MILNISRSLCGNAQDIEVFHEAVKICPRRWLTLSYSDRGMAGCERQLSKWGPLSSSLTTVTVVAGAVLAYSGGISLHWAQPKVICGLCERLAVPARRQGNSVVLPFVAVSALARVHWRYRGTLLRQPQANQNAFA